MHNKLQKLIMNIKQTDINDNRHAFMSSTIATCSAKYNDHEATYPSD